MVWRRREKRIAAYESTSRRSALANLLQTTSDATAALAFSGCRAAPCLAGTGGAAKTRRREKTIVGRQR